VVKAHALSVPAVPITFFFAQIGHPFHLLPKTTHNARSLSLHNQSRMSAIRKSPRGEQADQSRGVSLQPITTNDKPLVCNKNGLVLANKKIELNSSERPIAFATLTEPRASRKAVIRVLQFFHFSENPVISRILNNLPDTSPCSQHA
jgi:hypothetical protein